MKQCFFFLGTLKEIGFICLLSNPFLNNNKKRISGAKTNKDKQVL